MYGSNNMKKAVVFSGQFPPILGGQFELESGGHFKLELGGQYDWNLHIKLQIYKISLKVLHTHFCLVLVWIVFSNY